MKWDAVTIEQISADPMGRAEARMTLQRDSELRKGPRLFSLVINVGCPGQCITCVKHLPSVKGNASGRPHRQAARRQHFRKLEKMSACVLEGGSGCTTAFVLGSDHLP